MKFSLVILCYNEEKNIPLIYERLIETVGSREDVEILLVNNGSRDNSAAVLEGLQRTVADSRFRVISVANNQGYGNGILQGLSASTGDVMGWTHADMQTDPRDALTGFDIWRSQQSSLIVKGKRLERAYLETIFTFGMQVLASALLGVALDDINAQPKIFGRDFYEKVFRENAPSDFSLDLYLLYQARKNGLTIISIPVIFANRLHGEAKGGGSWKTRYKLITRSVIYIWKLRRQMTTKSQP